MHVNYKYLCTITKSKHKKKTIVRKLYKVHNQFNQLFFSEHISRLNQIKFQNA